MKYNIDTLFHSLSTKIRYHLHWIVLPLKVSFAIEVQTEGWAALAWSPDGGMLGSNAVVGFATGPNGVSGGVEAYNLGGFAMFQVKNLGYFARRKN